MSSTYTVFPSSYVDKKGGKNLPSHNDQHIQSSAPNYLSPNSSGYIPSNSASPTVYDTNTPAESVSVLSVNYQSSDYTDVGDDPFYHINFDAVEGASPSFLVSDEVLAFDEDQSFATPPHQGSDAGQEPPYQPISPGHTPYQDTASPNVEHQGLRSSHSEQFPQTSVSPQQLSRPFSKPTVPFENDKQATYTLTPTASGSRNSSDGDVAVEPAPVMSGQSPYVTVSVWGNDNEGKPPVAAIENRTYVSDQVDGASHVAATSSVRDAEGRWVREDAALGTGGLDPEHRPQGEVAASINETSTKRGIETKNQEVAHWITESTNPGQYDGTNEGPSSRPVEEEDGISPTEIPLGDATENKPLPGQTYFLERGGELTAQDIEIIRQNRNFADAPILEKIHATDPGNAHQPATSQAAIEKFERMLRDNDSVISRAATWGTRRRSFPRSILDSDYEEVLSGNFLRKLNMGNGESNRRPSLLSRAFQGLKRQSSSSKRSRPSVTEDYGDQLVESPSERRESRDSLAPPTRTPSGGLGGSGKKQSVPSINTAFVSMSASVAAVGTAHVRSGSISATPSVTSPKSPSNLSLGVKNMLRRPRSGSELTAMWKKSGGPPVARLAKTTSAPPVQAPVCAPEQDEDEEEEEELYGDAEQKSEAIKYVDDMEPTTAGFKDHILKLNPMLRTENTWLVERIAYHQVARYKNLLNARIKHLNVVANRQCLCGNLCIDQGGSAIAIDTKGDARQDPLSASAYHDGSDGDLTPLEGAIGQESFPQDIPMPPTRLLPAEFECQLCFQAKKFSKPSDWTKHVHEDVQPFTCTWDRCREPKTFKRKADWVRHENEGHRHLEWWTCNVEDCTHICYRRDNFLQHLVREHKFAEPRVKTKAAIKRAGGMDPTWQKVEECHHDTAQTSLDEPCRFCGRTFPSWKKLTVHLAKHMEQISLPVLRLVSRKAVEVDTIISPIQDPPPRTFPTLPAFQPHQQHQQGNIKMEHNPFNHSPNLNRQLQYPLAYPNAHQQHPFYPVVPSHLPTTTQMAQPPHFQQQGFYNSHHHPQQQQHQQQYTNISQALEAQINLPVSSHGFATNNNPQQTYANMPVSTGTYMAGGPNPYISVGPDTEPFPAFVVSTNPLGLQDMSDAHGLPYGDVMDQGSAAGDAYTPVGSHRSSPYLHSPGQGQGQFYPH